jgi:hypothetical protein
LLGVGSLWLSRTLESKLPIDNAICIFYTEYIVHGINQVHAYKQRLLQNNV